MSTAADLASLPCLSLDLKLVEQLTATDFRLKTFSCQQGSEVPKAMSKAHFRFSRRLRCLGLPQREPSLAFLAEMSVFATQRALTADTLRGKKHFARGH